MAQLVRICLKEAHIAAMPTFFFFFVASVGIFASDGNSPVPVSFIARVHRYQCSPRITNAVATTNVHGHREAGVGAGEPRARYVTLAVRRTLAEVAQASVRRHDRVTAATS